MHTSVIRADKNYTPVELRNFTFNSPPNYYDQWNTKASHGRHPKLLEIINPYIIDEKQNALILDNCRPGQSVVIISIFMLNFTIPVVG